MTLYQPLHSTITATLNNLLLWEDVVTAVANHQFHIYPIDHIDQGIERLTGVPAGKLDGDGKYEEGSVNGRVETRLIQLAAALHAHSQPPAAAVS